MATVGSGGDGGDRLLNTKKKTRTETTQKIPSPKKKIKVTGGAT